MDANLKEAVDFHRGVLVQHAHAPGRMPRESVMIVLLGDLLVATEPQNHPAKAKKAKK